MRRNPHCFIGLVRRRRTSAADRVRGQTNASAGGGINNVARTGTFSYAGETRIFRELAGPRSRTERKSGRIYAPRYASRGCTKYGKTASVRRR